MRVTFLLLLLTMVVGCREDTSQTQQVDQRTKDSVVGASGLPGAKGVQGALEASDSIAARNARLDSLNRQP